MQRQKPRQRLPQPASLILTLGLIILLAFFGPLERTLGINIRIIYFHAAWVWAALVAFAASGLTGAAALITRRSGWHHRSRSMALTALVFWLTYLPVSLLVMQLNWGGFFFDEPRWKVPLTFAIIAVLLQAGLFLLNQPQISSAANFLFAAALFWSLGRAENILHPDSPILESNSLSIKIFFAFLFLLTFFVACQICDMFQKKLPYTPEKES